MSRSAFLLGCVHWAREAAAAWTRAAVTPGFPATKVDARTTAWLPEVRAPSALQAAPARHSLSQPVPPLASAPHDPQDGGEGARRPRRGQPLCPPGRGPPTGSPTRSPRHAGNARSRVSAPRHSRGPQHFFFFLPYSAPPHVRSSSGSWARVPGGDDWPPAGTRTPGEGGPSACHALRPCRFSAEDAR